MVNHYASLLSNLNLYDLEQTPVAYLLLSEDEYDITTEDNNFIDIAADYERSSEMVRLLSPMINREYTQIELPVNLQKFYDIIFPSAASNYYKQFLLFCYLRLIDATDIRNDVKKYDSRLSYELDLIQNYFKFNRIYLGPDNPKDYTILISGKLKASQETAFYSNRFLISQVPNTADVLVYSATQNSYYKLGKAPSLSSAGMAISLDNRGGSLTVPVLIGDTGLSFRLNGSFSDFISPVRRVWEFTAEAPFNFDFQATMTELEAQRHLVDNMLDYGREECNISYENMWNTHYNSVYRFVGLLHAYVERVNIIYGS